MNIEELHARMQKESSKYHSRPYLQVQTVFFLAYMKVISSYVSALPYLLLHAVKEQEVAGHPFRTMEGSGRWRWLPVFWRSW